MVATLTPIIIAAALVCSAFTGFVLHLAGVTLKGSLAFCTAFTVLVGATSMMFVPLSWILAFTGVALHIGTAIGWSLYLVFRRKRTISNTRHDKLNIGKPRSEQVAYERRFDQLFS